MFLKRVKGGYFNMAKIAFSKLALKKQEEIKTININNNAIEIKQYLPVNDKLALISKVVNLSHDSDNNFPNPIKVEIIGTLEIIYAYTNLSFTDKQKEDIGKLYDLLESNGVVTAIIEQIPEEEYSFVINGINETIEAVYKYQNSVLGILDSISQDYSNLELDATKIQNEIADPENLKLLKGIMTKLG